MRAWTPGGSGPTANLARLRRLCHNAGRGERPCATDERAPAMIAFDSQTEMELAFLAEIVGRPNDPLTLSVYADWLMDQPDELSRSRGEYLRMESLLAGRLSERERSDLRWQ